jgi:hypothetical protein
VLLAAKLLALLSDPVATSLIGPLTASAAQLWGAASQQADVLDALTVLYTEALALSHAVRLALATAATDLLLAADAAAQAHASRAEALCGAVAKCAVSAALWPQAAAPLLERLRQAQAERALWTATGAYVAALIAHTPTAALAASGYHASLSALLVHRATRAPRLAWRLAVLPVARAAYARDAPDVALLTCLVAHPEPELRAGALAWLSHATEPPNALPAATAAALWPSLPALARDPLLHIRRLALVLLQRLLPRLPPDSCVFIFPLLSMRVM